MKTKLTLLGGAAILAATGMGLATEVQAKEVWGKGAPEFQDPDGNIKFKVRGRIQMDYVYQDQDLDNTVLTAGAVRSVATNSNDKTFSQTRVRRMRLGVEGQFDSKFKYKIEYTFAGRNAGANANAINDENRSEAQLEDAYIEYVGGNNWSIVVGHQDLGYTLERLTSSRFSTNMERNFADQAFGFNRTLGVGLLLAGDSFGGWGGQFFVNGDSASNPDIASGGEEFSVRAHGYWTPINTPEQLLYVGATYRLRDSQKEGAGIRYRARPENNIGDRGVDTGALGTNSSDNLYSVEAAGKFGPFYAQGEYTMVEADATTGAGAARYDYSPEFSSYFVQAGWFLTGESRPYKGGKFDRVTPNAPVSEGGLGAWELRARYDYVDLADNGTARTVGGTTAIWNTSSATTGGTMDAWTVGVNWNPVKNVRFMGEYVKAQVSDFTIPTAALAATTTANKNGDYDVFQLRAQFDF